MTAGMAEVIAAHYMDRDTYICDCGWVWAEHAGNAGSPLIHAAHVAEELAKAGYGNVRKAFGAAADELARLPYVKPGDDGRDEYERMLAIRRGDTDKWLRERVEPQHG